MQKHSRHPTAAIAITLCLAAGAISNAEATELGGSSYPIGVDTNFGGVMLSPGWHNLFYLNNYDASHLRDNSGGDNRALSHYHLQATTFAYRFSYVWPNVQVLGAQLETRGAIPIPSIDLDRVLGSGANLSGSTTRQGDPSFSPLLLGWSNGGLHQIVGMEMILPLGSYDKTRPVNAGRNYWQFGPYYGVTWFPATWAEASAKLRYGINQRNKDTDYKSGDEATLEFSVGYRFSPSTSLGLNGYVYRQATDDKVHGAVVNGNGNRGRANAFGPYVSHSFSKDFSVVLKMQDESSVRNRADGIRVWLQTRLDL